MQQSGNRASAIHCYRAVGQKQCAGIGLSGPCARYRAVGHMCALSGYRAPVHAIGLSGVSVFECYRAPLRLSGQCNNRDYREFNAFRQLFCCLGIWAIGLLSHSLKKILLMLSTQFLISSDLERSWDLKLFLIAGLIPYADGHISHQYPDSLIACGLSRLLPT